MLRGILKIANKLDQLGLTKEADYLDSLAKKLSDSVLVKNAYAVPTQTLYEDALKQCDNAFGCTINHSGQVYTSVGGSKYKDPSGKVISREELMSELAKSRIVITDSHGKMIYEQ